MLGESFTVVNLLLYTIHNIYIYSFHDPKTLSNNIIYFILPHRHISDNKFSTNIRDFAIHKYQ